MRPLLTAPFPHKQAPSPNIMVEKAYSDLRKALLESASQSSAKGKPESDKPA